MSEAEARPDAIDDAPESSGMLAAEIASVPTGAWPILREFLADIGRALMFASVWLPVKTYAWHVRRREARRP